MHSRVSLLDGTNGVFWERDVDAVSAVEQTSQDNLQEVAVAVAVAVAVVVAVAVAGREGIARISRL